MNDLFVELFEDWPTWATLVGYLSRSKPTTADPQSIYGAACAVEQDRLACRIYGSGIGSSLDHATEILNRVLAMAREGRRPRFGRELGIDVQDFQDLRSR